MPGLSELSPGYGRIGRLENWLTWRWILLWRPEFRALPSELRGVHLRWQVAARRVGEYQPLRSLFILFFPCAGWAQVPHAFWDYRHTVWEFVGPILVALLITAAILSRNYRGHHWGLRAILGDGGKRGEAHRFFLHLTGNENFDKSLNVEWTAFRANDDWAPPSTGLERALEEFDVWAAEESMLDPLAAELMKVELFDLFRERWERGAASTFGSLRD